MTWRSFCLAAVAGIFWIAGCEREETPPAPPKTPPPAPQVDSGTVAPARSEAAGAAANAGAAALTQAPIPQAPAVDAAAVEATTKETESKLQEIFQYIKEKKFDLADSALKQIEQRKTSLPATLHPRIEQARKLLDSARSGGIQIPNVPGIGK